MSPRWAAKGTARSSAMGSPGPRRKSRTPPDQSGSDAESAQKHPSEQTDPAVIMPTGSLFGCDRWERLCERMCSIAPRSFANPVHKKLMRAVWAAVRTAYIPMDVASKVLPSIGPAANKFGLIFASRDEALAFEEAFDRNLHDVPQADGRPAIRFRVGPPQDDSEKARLDLLQGLRRLEHGRPAGAPHSPTSSQRSPPQHLGGALGVGRRPRRGVVRRRRRRLAGVASNDRALDDAASIRALAAATGVNPTLVDVDDVASP